MTTVMRIWLVEDDASYRRTISGLVESAADMTVSEQFGSCEAALKRVDGSLPPDVVLQDIGLPGLSGVACVRGLLQKAPDARIIMLTVHEDEKTVFEALCAGASGYLVKHTSPRRILEAIREVHRGGVLFSPSIARQVLRHFDQDAPRVEYGVTEREREVLRLLADGHTQKEIAESLYLSPHTIESHLRHVYAKLHVRNAHAAISKAIREHLI